VHGEALQALELPAILERLAAAAATELGAALARSLAPSAVLDEVGARQALTAEAIVLLDAADDPPLAGVTDIASFVERAERDGVLSPADLRSVSVSARVAVDARRVVHGRRDAVPLLAAIAERVEPSLVQLAEAIDRCVEVDGSDLRDDASPKLRTLRRQLRNGDARLRDELARIARSAGVRDALQESFLAERGGRPVLAVRASSRDQVPGIVHDASGSGQTVFIEPHAVVELGNKLAEAAAEAREEMERILRELSADVASRGDALRALVEAVGELDLAVARGSLSRSWHGAEVQVAGEVRLVGARHPLLDRATAVPIDLDLGELRALVISGPNTGGKTVALKTLGLAALLHQCGLRPPAAEAALPVFDEVLADIGDRQSIEMSLSTFSGHVRTLVAILASATERSLVLLDEVAAGTDPEEGSALAQALVERLAGQARLTVVTTHYGELKEWASARAGVANAATGFDVEADTPLYRLALGRPGTSHALRIAERLGLDPAVVADARSRVAPERLRAAELVAEAESAERAAGERHAEVEETARRVAAREAELERELERVRASAERARREAVADVERELADARAEIAALRTPSMAGVLRAVVGPWGSMRVSVGLMVSVAGAYLAWILLAAEVLRAAAGAGIMPSFLGRENRHGVPAAALWLSNGIVQLFLIVTLFTEDTFVLLKNMASSMSLMPYFFVAAFGLMLTVRGETYNGWSGRRKVELALAVAATVYAAGLVYAGGFRYFVLSCVIYAPGTILFLISRREQRGNIFAPYEWPILILVLVSCGIGVWAISTGNTAF
jgi:dsDNA-specific endonuclease/ATPase MutS2